MLVNSVFKGFFNNRLAWGYSYFSLSTGLALAVRMDLAATTTRAMSITKRPGRANSHQCRSMWLEKLLSQLFTAYQATGAAMMNDRKMSCTYSFESITKMSPTVAPNTLRTATSLPLRFTTNVMRP